MAISMDGQNTHAAIWAIMEQSEWWKQYCRLLGQTEIDCVTNGTSGDTICSGSATYWTSAASQGSGFVWGSGLLPDLESALGSAFVLGSGYPWGSSSLTSIASGTAFTSGLELESGLAMNSELFQEDWWNSMPVIWWQFLFGSGVMGSAGVLGYGIQLI